MSALFARLARTGAATCALLCLGATTAHAADGTEPTPLRAADRTAATEAAGSDLGLDLALRVATLRGGSDAPHSGADRVPATPGATPRVVAGTTTEVTVLARDFVADGSGPIGELGYVATTVDVDDRLVSVWTVPAKGGGWEAVNAATGNLEAQMGTKAKGGTLLREPQVNAWYAVKGDRVLPLNDEAREAVGTGMSTDDYQELVHDRYADKLPGSEYAESGTAGGYGDEPSSGPSTNPAVALGGFGAAGALAVGFVAMRRRRQA